MTDLDEIVESFKLNIPKIEPERLAEIVGLLDAVPKTKLNHILDKIQAEAENNSGWTNELAGMRYEVKTVLDRVREEVQKIV